MPHPESITPLVTTGHVTTHEDLAVWWNDRGLWNGFNALDPEHGDPNAAYAAAVAAGGGVVVVPPGSYNVTTDWVWNSNVVSVICAGSGTVFFNLVGTAKLKIGLPTPLTTVAQGPKFYGFTVRGDASAPINTVGIQFGDITGAKIDDVVVERFTGSGSVGVLVDTAHQTELNTFGRMRISNAKVGIKFTNSNPANNSLARFVFRHLHLDVKAGQTGFQMRDETILYGAHLRIVGNMDGAGTFFDIGAGTSDTCGINGGHWEMAIEQTSGTGGVPYRVGTTSYAFGESGYFRAEHLQQGVIDGGARQIPGWRPPSTQALVAGVDSAPEGQIANFLGSGETVNVHPLLWDWMQAPLATIGFITGNNVRSPYVCFFDAPQSAFVVYKNGSGVPNALTEMFRVTSAGIALTNGIVTTAANQAALGSGAPAPATSGNSMKGTISVGSGTGTAAGTAVRVTFATAWPRIPEVVLQPLTAGCYAVQPIVVRATTHFDIYFVVAPAASQPLGTYAWSWHAA